MPSTQPAVSTARHSQRRKQKPDVTSYVRDHLDCALLLAKPQKQLRHICYLIEITLASLDDVETSQVR